MAQKKEKKVQLVATGAPQSLIDDIDELAETEVRSRSNQTVLLLQEIVAIKKAAKATGGGGNRTRLEGAAR